MKNPAGCYCFWPGSRGWPRQPRGQAVDYPQRPITLIVPFRSGRTDRHPFGRIVAETLSAKIGQTVIVGEQGRGRRSDRLRSDRHGRARRLHHRVGDHLDPRGQSVVQQASPVVRSGAQGFARGVVLQQAPEPWWCGKVSAPPDFAAFRERLKKDSEQYNLGTAGPARSATSCSNTSTRNWAAGSHVPYRGSGPAASDLLGGSLDMMMDIYPLLGPHIAAGKLTALAVAWPSRLSRLPDTPTFDELGLPDLSTTSWYGLVAPAGLPADRLAGLSRKIGESLQDPGLRRRFEEAYIHAAPQESPQAFKDFLAAQFSKESAFIQSRNMGAN